LGRAVILLIGLPQGLVGFLGLFLKQLQSPCEGLVLGAVLLTVVGGLLQVRDLLLELLDLGFEQAVLVRQRGDFLLLGEVLLLKGLHLGLELLGLG